MSDRINATRLLTSLEFCEVDGDLAPDCRAVIRDERFALSDALRTGDGRRIMTAAGEARRVCRMWGVNVDGR